MDVTETLRVEWNEGLEELGGVLCVFRTLTVSVIVIVSVSCMMYDVRM